MAEDVRIRTTLSGVAGVRAGFSGIGGSINKLESTVFSLKTAVAGLAGAFALKGIINTNKEIQKLQAQLKTFTGSTEAANQKWDELLDFASTTPFQIQDVVSSFQRLKAVGLDPTRRELEAFGDVAAGSGRSIIQFAEAVADATTGEFERLKEFGIVARSEGEQVALRFGETSITVQKNAQEITDALRSIAETNFAGAMEDQMNTLEGAFSQLGDATTNFAIAIGEGGLNDAVIETANAFTDLINGNDQLAKSLGQVTGDIVRLAVPAFQAFAENIDLVITGLAALAAFKFLAIFNPIVAAIGALGVGIATLVSGIGDVGEALDTAEERVKKFGGEIAGALQTAGGGLAEAIRVQEAVVASFQTTADLSREKLELLEAAQRDLKAEMDTSVQAMLANQNAFNALTAEIERQKDILREDEKALIAVVDELVRLEQAQKEANRATGEASNEVKTLTDAHFQLANTIKRTVEANREFTEAEKERNKELADALTEADQDWRAIMTQREVDRLEQIEREQEASKAAARQHANDWIEELRRRKDAEEKDAADKEQREQDAHQRAFDRLTDTSFHAQDVAASMHTAFQGFFKGIVTGSATLAEGLQNLFASLVDAILSEFARLAASYVFQVLFGSGGNAGVGRQIGNQVLAGNNGSLLGNFGAGGQGGGGFGIPNLGQFGGGGQGGGIFSGLTALFGGGGTAIGFGGAGGLATTGGAGIAAIQGGGFAASSAGGASAAAGASSGAGAAAGAGPLGLYVLAAMVGDSLRNKIIPADSLLGTLVGDVAGNLLGYFFGSGARGGISFFSELLTGSPFSLFQRGGSFITQGPTPIIAGEAGPEHVTITPTNRRGGMMAANGGVTIVLEGPTVFDEITMEQFANKVSDVIHGRGRGSITRGL